jgi:cytochrome P450
MVTFLAGDSEWKLKAMAEVHNLVAIHSAANHNEKADLANQLSSISLEVWENCTPVMDQIIRETLRVAQPHTAMRRNVGPDTYINGTSIPSGAYVVYPFSDVHLNPNVYPDPWRFDPGRPESDLQFGYIGWGGGASQIAIDLVQIIRFETDKVV